MKAPRPTEKQTQKAFVELITPLLRPAWFFFHVPNGEWRHPATAAQLQLMGVKRGVSDFIFLGPRHYHGGAYFLELKREGFKGRMSDDQIAFRDHVMRICGFTYHCTNDLQDACDQLFDYGILRARVTL